jgi:hypothetical protein
MDAADIRAFVARDWAGLEDQKARFWADRKRTMSPSEALEVADGLRRHAQALKPDWPDPAERAADLAVHRRVAEALGACSRLRSR